MDFHEAMILSWHLSFQCMLQKKLEQNIFYVFEFYYHHIVYENASLARGSSKIVEESCFNSTLSQKDHLKLNLYFFCFPT